MNTLKISEITKSNRAISAVDGEKVHQLISRSFNQNEKVTLDFEGIDLTITAFLNSSIGKLYAIYSQDKIKELLNIVNLHPEEVQLLKLVIDVAKERFNRGYSPDQDNVDVVNES